MISVANAQFSAGDKYLSGSFSAGWAKNTPSNNEQKQFNLAFSPAFTKFKTDKKATGFRILTMYGESKSTNGVNTQKLNQYGLGAGVFSQNYFPLGKGFYFFAEKGIEATYANAKVTQSSLPSNEVLTQGYSASIYLKPGIGYKLTNRLLLNLEFANILNLTYGHSKTENTVGATKTVDKNTSLNFGSSLNNISLGDLGITFAWKLK
jgi:hypothetical protein